MLASGTDRDMMTETAYAISRLLPQLSARAIGQRFLQEEPAMMTQDSLSDLLLDGGSRLRAVPTGCNSQMLMLQFRQWCRSDFRDSRTYQLHNVLMSVTELAACGTAYILSSYENALP